MLYDTIKWDKFMSLYSDVLTSTPTDELFIYEINTYKWDDYIVKFVDKAIHDNENLDKCLELLIKIIFQNTNECMYFDECLINRLLDAGANFQIDKLFNPEYSNDSYNVYVPGIGTIKRYITLYDETLSYPLRGKLIDLLMKRNLIDINKYADWKDVEAKDIDKYEKYDKVTENRRYEILKFYSEGLKMVKCSKMVN